MMDAQGNAEPEEYSDSRYYCEHGTFIGNPYGADYMCGFCESGATDEEVAAYRLRQDRVYVARMVYAEFCEVIPAVVWGEGAPLSLVCGIMVNVSQYK
jgi:hypothetical protein